MCDGIVSSQNESVALNRIERLSWTFAGCVFEDTFIKDRACLILEYPLGLGSNWEQILGAMLYIK